MGNNQPTSYTVPEITESPEESITALNKLHGERLADEGHPLNQPAHPQRKDFIDAQTRLYEIKNQELELELSEPATTHKEFSQAQRAERFKPEHIAAMAEGIANQEKKQLARVQEATLLVDDMVENFNFEKKEIPSDISDWQIRAWRMQKSLAEEKFAEVASSIQNELRILNADAATISSVDTAMMPGDFPKKYRDKFFKGLIDECLSVHRRRAANPRTNFGELMQSFGGV